MPFVISAHICNVFQNIINVGITCENKHSQVVGADLQISFVVSVFSRTMHVLEINNILELCNFVLKHFRTLGLPLLGEK